MKGCVHGTLTLSDDGKLALCVECRPHRTWLIAHVIKAPIDATQERLHAEEDEWRGEW